jgi:hypothetical protein
MRARHHTSDDDDRTSGDCANVASPQQIPTETPLRTVCLFERAAATIVSNGRGLLVAFQWSCCSTGEGSS